MLKERASQRGQRALVAAVPRVDGLLLRQSAPGVTGQSARERLPSPAVGSALRAWRPSGEDADTYA